MNSVGGTGHKTSEVLFCSLPPMELMTALEECFTEKGYRRKSLAPSPKILLSQSSKQPNGVANSPDKNCRRVITEQAVFQFQFSICAAKVRRPYVSVKMIPVYRAYTYVARNFASYT